MHNTRCKTGYVVASTLIALAISAPASAQRGGWSLEPILRVGLESDDNANLDFRTDEEVKLDGYLLDATLGIIYESRRTTFDFTPQVLVRSYPDEPDYDSDDLFLKSRYRFVGERSELRFRVNFDEQQIWNAERADSDLDAEEPDDITDDQSGRVGTLGSRSKWRLVPSWSYQMTTKASIGADLEYFDVQYEDVPLNTLTDYTDARLSLNFGYQLTPRTTGILRGSYRDYQSDDVLGSELTGYRGLVGFETDLSDTTSLRFLVGAETTDFELADSETDVVGEVYLRKSLQTIELFALYRRNVNATGSGRLSVRDSIDLSATRRLTEKISAGVGVRAYESDRLGAPSVSIEPQQYVQLRARFTWFITRAFSAEFGYRYTYLDRSEVVSEGANGNSINVWLSYHPRSEPR